MTYCPLCMPQIGVTPDGFIIVRKIPLSEFHPSSFRTYCLELETGMHIITKGVLLELENKSENEMTVQVCHPASDWQIKHLLPEEDILESHQLIRAAILEYETARK